MGWLAGALVFASMACGADDPVCDTDPRTVIGRACDATNPCPCGTICGNCGIATGRCVVACSVVGPPSVSGCPAGTFCSRAFGRPNFDSHFCVRTCDNDLGCHAAPGDEELSCNGAYADDGSDPGVNICNVDNWIGSSHTCS